MEVEAEEADDQVSHGHAADRVEGVLDVRRSKQTQGELDGVLGVAETELDHVEEPAVRIA